MRLALVAMAALAMSACAPAPTAPDAADKAANKAFVEGNLFFIAYHELGHALVSEFGLPIAGREEDAVDRLAIWMMTPASSDEAPDYLIDAMGGWFSLAEETSLEDIGWWEEHSTSQQRGYQIACLLYGSDPSRFGELADGLDLPPERRETCVDEAAQNDAAWNSLLAGHLRAVEAAGDPRDVAIVYAAAPDFADEAAYLREIGLLEHLAEIIMVDFRFAAGITLAAEQCADANAFWDAETRQLTICYELVRDYRRLAGATG